MLANQNRWAEISSWTVYAHSKQENDILFVAIGIPERVIPKIMERGRRLAHNLGNVYVRFYSADGTLQDEPPTAETPTRPEPQPGPSALETPAGGQHKPTPTVPPHSSPTSVGPAPMETMCADLERELDLEGSEEEEGNQDDGDPISLLL